MYRQETCDQIRRERANLQARVEDFERDVERRYQKEQVKEKGKKGKKVA